MADDDNDGGKKPPASDLVSTAAEFVPGKSAQSNDEQSMDLPNTFVTPQTSPPLNNSYQYQMMFDKHNVELLRQVSNPSDPRYKEIPPEFTAIYPLDRQSPDHRDAAGSFGYASHLYKATSTTDGITYALRRVENVKTNRKITSVVSSRWKSVCQSGESTVIRLHRVFTLNKTVFFLYDYIPGVQSLESFLSSTKFLPQPILWKLVCQVASALAVIHSNGLACRVLGSKHVLVVPSVNDVKFWISNVGILDVVEYDHSSSMDELQRLDLVAFGKMLRSVTGTGYNNCSKLASLISALVTSASTNDSIHSIIDRYVPSSVVLSTLSGQIRESQNLERLLRQEYQNKRLLDLCIKLGLIANRSTCSRSVSATGTDDWSSTGDRYLVSLFRDYVFHQTTAADGESSTMVYPILDYGHIVDSLNKLDVGTADENVLLCTSDGNSMIVASFEEVRACVEKSFMELVHASSGGGTSHAGGYQANNAMMMMGGGYSTAPHHQYGGGPPPPPPQQQHNTHNNYDAQYYYYQGDQYNSQRQQPMYPPPPHPPSNYYG